METAVALAIGILVATGVYLMLERCLLQYLFGLVLLSNAANLAIFAAGRLTRATPPLVPAGMTEPPQPVANPLSQALILTALVIGFGLLAFALALIARSYARFGTLNSDRIRVAEPVTPEENRDG
ncbi:Na+/H+ antiporter subunit C [Microbulbifer discodermiae]|uniref:Na+/H+ antiporter subunit C n=1 Tax=Microbulbifer sp. 2201CG32-9 TaxID=3232309 RepID=UPI00345B940C